MINNSQISQTKKFGFKIVKFYIKLAKTKTNKSDNLFGVTLFKS